jgi:hypothetical protein
MRRASVRAPATEDRDQRVDGAGEQHDPQQRAQACFQHARVGHPQEHAQRDRPVQQAAMAVAERVQGDVVFPVEAQPEIADRDAEADVQERFEGVRELSARGQEVDRGGDQRDDRDVARGFEAAAHRAEGSKSGCGAVTRCHGPKGQLTAHRLPLRLHQFEI